MERIRLVGVPDGPLLCHISFRTAQRQRNYDARDLVATHACLVVMTFRLHGGDGSRLKGTEASRHQAQVGSLG